MIFVLVNLINIPLPTHFSNTKGLNQSSRYPLCAPLRHFHTNFISKYDLWFFTIFQSTVVGESGLLMEVALSPVEEGLRKDHVNVTALNRRTEVWIVKGMTEKVAITSNDNSKFAEQQTAQVRTHFCS